MRGTVESIRGPHRQSKWATAGFEDVNIAVVH